MFVLKYKLFIVGDIDMSNNEMRVEYKWSKFNYDRIIDSYAILVNTVYFDIIKVGSDSIIYNCYKNNTIEGLNQSHINFLLENNFIVNVNTNEVEFCNFVRQRSVYADSVLDLMILPTDTCNFRCVYCYEKPNKQFMSETSENSLLSYLTRNVRKYKKVGISWFGGEPLVCKEQVLRITQKMNEICKSNGIPFSGRMTTNAYELDVEAFNLLVKNRIMYYQICIDGFEITHNKQRPHSTNSDSYQRIMNNIREIKQTSKTNGFLISLRSNITKETELYLEQYLIELYSIIGNDKRFEVAFQGVRNWGGGNVEANNVDIVDDESYLYEKWFSIAAQIGLNSAETMDLSVRTGICSANFIEGYVVYPDCSVHKCTLAYANEKLKSEGCIGQIDTKGVLTLDYNKIIKWMSHDYNDLTCCDCFMYPLCVAGSCPYSSNIQGNSINLSSHCDNLKAFVNSKILCMNIKGLIPDISLKAQGE